MTVCARAAARTRWRRAHARPGHVRARTRSTGSAHTTHETAHASATVVRCVTADSCANQRVRDGCAHAPRRVRARTRGDAQVRQRVRCTRPRTHTGASMPAARAGLHRDVRWA
eukprot:2453263-Pleurochrysis_carterae.AAC.2